MIGSCPFSASYEEARARFVEAAQTAGGVLSRHTMADDVRGPQGETLSMDTAWFGPRAARSVLLNTSATHGAEGYAGSAAQLDWIENGGARRLPSETAMLLVHGVNPFGFAWGLRGSENNVDLNRNWLDHSLPHPENTLYEQIHPLLCPRKINDKAMTRLLEEGSQLIAKHGQWAVEDAISRGQYSHPSGFHYGGNGLEWSTATLKQIVERDLGSAEHVAFIDWHTGPVGDGDLIFLCFSPPYSAGFQRAASWWGREALDMAHVERLWGSKRPSRHGILFWGVEQALAPQTAFAGAVIEFRSAAQKQNAAEALRVTMLERWLRFEGGFDAPEAKTYFEEIRRDYAPNRESFRANVIANARTTYAQTFRGLASWQVRDAAD